MFEGLFEGQSSSVKVKPQTNNMFEGLFSNVEKKKEEPKKEKPKTQLNIQGLSKPKVSTLPEFLGGGSYYGTMQDRPPTTPHTTYGGFSTKTGFERQDIIPAFAGGVNVNPKNIRYDESGNWWDKLTGKTVQELPHERRQLYYGESRLVEENKLYKQYKNKEISRAEMITELKRWDFEKELEETKEVTKKDIISGFGKQLEGFFTDIIPLKQFTTVALPEGMRTLSKVLESSSQIVSTLPAWGLSALTAPDQETFGKEVGDIAQSNFDIAKDIWRGGETGTEKAAQMYLKERNLKDIKDTTASDVLVLSSMALNDIFGHWILYAGGIVGKVGNKLVWKKMPTKKVVEFPGTKRPKQFPKGTTYEVPITKAGDLKVVVKPQNNQIVLEGYAKRFVKAKPSTDLAVYADDVTKSLSLIGEQAGVNLSPKISGNNLVVGVTPKIAPKVTQLAGQSIEDIRKTYKATPTNISKAISETKIKDEALKAEFAVEAQTLRGTKGMTADDIQKTYPNIKLTKDVPAKDIYGNKVVIPNNEVLTPYELKGNKILLQDGETYIVSKNQFQNIKGQSVGGEAKEFAPELAKTEETIRGEIPKASNILPKGLKVKKASSGKFYVVNDAGAILTKEFETSNEAILDHNRRGLPDIVSTKFSEYQLPAGKDYREILIQAPAKTKTITAPDGHKVKDVPVGNFISPHFDEPNILAWIRGNTRTFKGDNVFFMEEIQSDWASEARKKGFVEPLEWKADKDGNLKAVLGDRKFGITKGGRTFYVFEEGGILGQAVNTLEKAKGLAQDQANKGSVPPNPLLKNWQELAVKRGLQEAVNSGAKYFSWISGEQTSARYNLATHLDGVNWFKQHPGLPNDKTKGIELDIKERGNIDIKIDKTGKVIEASGRNGATSPKWEGKKLDEVLGKGLADKIMGKEKGELSGEGLKFGGEWATNLYDKQIPNIVKDLIGVEIIEMDLGLPVEKANRYDVNKLRDGDTIKLNNGEPVKVEKVMHTFYADGVEFTANDVALGKEKIEIVKGKMFPTTTQQAIKITPEVKRIIKGEAPILKQPSGKKFEPKPIKVEEKPEVKKPPAPLIKEKFSLHYERIKEELGLTGEGISRDVKVLKEEAQKEYNYIQRNPEKALRIAYNIEEAPKGHNAQGIRLSLKEAFRKAGKTAQADELDRLFSKGLTTAGYELNLAKLDLGNAGKRKIIQIITAKRLEKIGNKLGEFDPEKAKEVAKKNIKKNTEKVKDKVVKNQVKNAKANLAELDDIINSIIC